MPRTQLTFNMIHLPVLVANFQPNKLSIEI